MKHYNNFDPKFFEIKIKNNWKLQDFLEYFDLSEEEFKRHLKSILSRGYKDILRRIEKNEKVTEVKSVKSSNEVKQDEKELPRQTSELEQVLAGIRLAEAKKEGCLKSQEECLEKKREIAEKIDKSKKALIELQKEIRKHNSALQSYDAQLNNINQDLEIFREFYKSIETDISMLQERRKELEKIAIKVSNAEIDCCVEVPDTWHEMLNRLIVADVADDEEYAKLVEVVEDLRAKDLKLLSRIIALADLFEHQKKHFKVVFDEETDLAVAMQLLECFEVEICK